jgi:hypothetical protein
MADFHATTPGARLRTVAAQHQGRGSFKVASSRTRPLVPGGPAAGGAGRPRSDALWAGSVEVDLVGDVGVAVLLGELACEVFNFAGGEPDRAPAPSAQ